MKMPQIEKKAVERKQLLAFQQSCPDCPRSAPAQPSPPAPDIMFPESELGVEITEYSLGQGKDGSRPRQHEKVHQRIANAAKAEYGATMKHNLQVTIRWTNSTECPTVREESELAKAIAGHVAINTTTRIGDRFVDWGPSTHTLIEKYGIDVGIYPLEGEGQGCWSSTACFSFPDEAHRIQAALDEKESKVLGYRKSCKEIWLLIVAAGAYFSSQFSPDPKLADIRFVSSFDRAFLLDEHRKSVHEFKTMRKSS